MDNSSTEKLIIIGSGPAGLTAAIYAARGDLQPLVISGRAAGGQLMLTTDVDDFPGFPEGIQGPELMARMRKQAERFGTRFTEEDVLEIDFKARPFKISTETKTFTCKSVIVATGASARWLGLPSEAKFIGKGVSACAVCDGFFFKGKEVIVVGGGDAAMREAQHLSKFCSKITVVHRRDTLRAQPALQELVKSKPNVGFIWNSEVEEFLGEGRLSAVKLKNVLNNKVTTMQIDGAFIAIGHRPNTLFLKDGLELDENGYIKIYDEVKTSVEGVFWAGDVADKKYKQAVTAAGAGCKAALEVEHFLEG